VLDEDAVLEHGDLRSVIDLADDHHAFDGLATREELSLGQQRRAAASLFTPLATPLLLRLQPGRALDPGDPGFASLARLPHVDHRALRVVRASVVAGPASAATTSATTGGGTGLLAGIVGSLDLS
jgi:hypothetical protein